VDIIERICDVVSEDSISYSEWKRLVAELERCSDPCSVA